MMDEIATDTSIDSQPRRAARRISYGLLWVLNHWLLLFLSLFGVWWIIPFFAPVFMRIGWTVPAQVIYLVYSVQCHQMAQRSIFLFGPQPMYNVAQLPIAMTGNDAVNILALRAFTGNSDLGWKVAWSDRMVYIYGAILMTGIAFGAIRRHRYVRPLRLFTLFALSVPLVLDGGTHFLSDITGGLLGGFRYSNHWLATLTGNALPAWLYAGDAIGSFNSLMRLITALLFGFAFAWFAIPYLDRSIRESAMILRAKLSVTA